MHPDTFWRTPMIRRIIPMQFWIIAMQFWTFETRPRTLENVSGRLSNVEKELPIRFWTVATWLVTRNWTLRTSSRVRWNVSR